MPITDKPLILVIDDEHYIAELLSEILLDEIECEVISALNGTQGLTRARESLPQLIITDLMMPRMDGHTLVRLLKSDATLRHIPIIIMSAVRQKPQWVEDENFTFIAKPFEPDDLVSTVQHILAIPPITHPEQGHSDVNRS